MKSSSLLFILVMAFTSPSFAQTPYSLTDALSGSTPSSGMVLAVGASSMRLLPNASPPKAGATLNHIATAFGLIARRFGSVTALAPPTMTLINANPSNPDVFQDLNPGDKFKIFAASLSQAEWQMLTGERGIGLSDLTDDRQKAMFAALFPKSLSARPRPFAGDYQGAQDITSDLPMARLRFGERMNLMVPSPDHSYIGMQDFYKPNGPPEYIATSDQAPEGKSTTFGVPVRDEVPNVLKATPLDWNAKPLQTPVSLVGIKTVGDLIQRVGSAAHLELYADARWEQTPMTLLGTNPTATGRDVLQALALCFTGTYRPVGSAFVLTADQVGDGTREQIWAEFAEEVRLAREEPINQATSHIAAAHSPKDLRWFGDPLAFSPEQTPKMDPRFPNVDLLFAQLTSAQQTAVHGLVAQLPGELAANNPLQVDLTAKFKLEARPQVQIIVPSIPYPITMDSFHLYTGLVFQPSMAEEMAKMRQEVARRKPKAPAPVNLADFSARLAAIPRRAVLAHPHTPAEVDALVASMHAIGLNQLWLNVFSEGTSFVSGTNDILSEALAATRGTDIQVFPVLNLLAWGKTAPAQDRDRTLRGEDTEQDDARLQKRDAPLFAAFQQVAEMGFEDFDYSEIGFGNIRVSPLAPDVSQRLTMLVKMLSARPGVAGLVWQDTVSPGYDPPAGYEPDSVGQVGYRTPLGYTEAARLAFLRQTHVDPLDILTTQNNTPNVSLFGDYAQNPTLFSRWNKFRADSDVHFLQTLYQATNVTPNSGPRIFIRQRWDDAQDSTGMTIWFGSWDSPRSPLPAFHRAGEDLSGGQSMPEQQDALTQAKMQSQIALLSMSPKTLPTASWLSGQLKKMPQGKTWDGFVLDLAPRAVFGGSTGTPLTEQNPLSQLAADMTPNK